MTVLYWIVVTLHITACLFLIGVVLLQQGKGQDLASAFGGGGTQTAFGPRGSANVLSRATTILAGMFMVTSLGLTIMKPRASSVLDKVPTRSASPAPTTPAPAASVPATTPPAAPAPSPAPQ
jgi:preprotein translocase subunit SecG